VMRFLLRPSTHAFRGLFDRTSCFPCLIDSANKKYLTTTNAKKILARVNQPINLK